MAHVGPMWVDVGKSHFLVMVICPSGAQMGYMWCIWALVSPGKTQMGPRSFASWDDALNGKALGPYHQVSYKNG